MLTFIDEMYEFSVLNSVPNKHGGACVAPKPLRPDHGQTAAMDVREPRAAGAACRGPSSSRFQPGPCFFNILPSAPPSQPFISARVLLSQILRIRRCSTMPFTLCTFQPLINELDPGDFTNSCELPVAAGTKCYKFSGFETRQI